MNEPQGAPKTSGLAIASLVLGVCGLCLAWLTSLPAIICGHIALGQIVAKKNCAWCHAIGEQDKSPHASAPPFRDIHQRHPVLALRQPISRAVVTPHDDMPKLQLSDIQVDQIVAYINSLKQKR